MDSFLKGIAILGLSVLGLVSLEVAQAASFDCSKARTRVEKLICQDPVISKLDGQLGTVYETDIARANPDQKKMLINDELLWLKNMRDLCSTQTCFKHAYWMRLAELKTFYVKVNAPISINNANKAEVKKILDTTPFKGTGGIKKCMGLLKSVKSMHGVKFISPEFYARSYSSTKLISLWMFIKKHCPNEYPHNAPLSYDYQCDSYYSSPDDMKLSSGGLVSCAAYYELPPYRIYKLSENGTKGQATYVISYNWVYGPMNRQGIYQVTHYPGIVMDEAFPTCKPISVLTFKPPARFQSPSFIGIFKLHEKYYSMYLVKSLASSIWLGVSHIEHKYSYQCMWVSFKKH